MQQSSKVLPFSYGTFDVDGEVTTYWNVMFNRDFGPWKAGHETNIKFNWYTGVMADFDGATGEGKHRITVQYQSK